jgi:hypothetical protein
MKLAEVQPGTVAMLSLGGRRGAVRVTVLSRLERGRWSVVDYDGQQRTATARQLMPMPVSEPLTPSEREFCSAIAWEATAWDDAAFDHEASWPHA